MTPAELLLIHAGHRTTIVEPTPRRSLALKCFTCDGRLTDLSGLVGLRPSAGRTTSTSNTPTAPRDPKPFETCPQHPGEFRTACRSCAADRLERQPDDPPPVSQVRNGADPTTIPEWQAARQRLAAKTAQRAQQRRADALGQTVTPPAPTLDQAPTSAEGSPA